MKNHDLNQIAKKIRREILDMIFRTNGSHIGCSLDIVEILTALYFNVLKIDPNKPREANRDRFILSKGHACAALYAVLAERGFFPKNRLWEYSQDGSTLAAHSTLGSLPGIEATAGSLGHGLSMGLGMAIAAKNKSSRAKVYVLVGDGECMEGSIWEAALLAPHYKLDNLILIVDNNNLITLDNLDKAVGLETLDNKFSAFGWKTAIVDGHNISALTKAITQIHRGKPLTIIAKTTKGKGISFMENKKEWHGKCPTQEQYEMAVKELQ